MSRLEFLPRRKECGLVDMSVNPVAVLKVVIQKCVDNVEGGEESDQIAIVVAVHVKGLVTGCFFRWSSRSRTFLWGVVEINSRGKTSLKLWLTINN